MERDSTVRSLGHDLCHRLKIMSCGSMIGASILFPLANDEGLSFGVVTLAIFVIAALAFHGLHLQPFVRFGPYTAAVALVLLFIAVLWPGSSRKELIPWLPLFIATLSLITVAIHKISQRMGPRWISVAADDNFSGVSIDPGSNHSLGSLSSRQSPLPVLESDRLSHLHFARHGPPSRMSHRTDTSGTELSLSSVVGQIQPHWDPTILGYFVDESPPKRDREEYHAENNHHYSGDPDSDSVSEHGTVEAGRPLLGSK